MTSRASQTGASPPPLPHAFKGEGPPLLLLPGLGGKGTSWQPFLEQASGSFRTLILELPGSARGPALTAPTSIGELAARVADTVEALGLQGLRVVGRSMGGMIAQELALLVPERIERVVLVSTSGRVDTHLAEVFRLWAQMAEAGVPPAIRHRSAMLWCLGARALADDRRVRAYLRAKLVADNPEGYAHQARACANHDALARLSGIRAPTLVVAGEDDRLTPLAHSEALAKWIPGARLETIGGAGHLPYLEAPEPFAGCVFGFLGETARESRAGSGSSREEEACRNASTRS